MCETVFQSGNSHVNESVWHKSVYMQSWYKKVGVLPIWILNSNVSSVSRSSERNMFLFLFLSDEGPTLETLYFTVRIGSTPTFLYFDLYLYTLPTHHVTFVYSLVLLWSVNVQRSDLRIISWPWRFYIFRRSND